MQYQNPEERTLGLRGALPAMFFVFGGGERPPSFVMEAGEMRLFGIAGLKRSCARVGARRHGWGCLVSAVRLASAVGGERVAAVEPFYAAGSRFGISLRSRVAVVRISGLRGSSLVSGGVGMFARVSSQVVIGYDIGGVRFSGEHLPGVETVVYLIVLPRSAMTLVSSLECDRWGRPGVAVAARLTWSENFRVSVGYDDSTSMLGGSITLVLRQAGIQAGAAMHPVLGLSKSLFLSWGRP